MADGQFAGRETKQRPQRPSACSIVDYGTCLDATELLQFFSFLPQVRSLTPSRSGFPEFRRSTRVPLKVVITVEEESDHRNCEGETVIVNLQGALITTEVALKVGMKISIHVYMTDKHAAAKVVYIDRDKPLQCGVELAEPQNIWGVPLPPNDWNDVTEPDQVKDPDTKAKNKEPRCPYCIADEKFFPMTVLSNGRLICKNCGHIVFPNDTAFKCPCQKCQEITLSPRVRKLRGKQT